MPGLERLIPSSEAAGEQITVKTARVISVTRNVLQVDLGGTAVQAIAVDMCNPRPNDNVVLLIQGATMTAIAVLGGPYRQATITVTADATNTVTGLINGVSTTIPKSSVFTATVGQVCPLLWSADGNRVWCLPNELQATSNPGAGTGAGGSPGGVSSGTSVYSARSMATWYNSYHEWSTGFARPSPTQYGLIFYGAGRFKELQGRKLTSFRAYLPKAAGSTSYVAISIHDYETRPPHAPISGFSPTVRQIGGWVSLPLVKATELVDGAGTGGLFLGSTSGDALINSGGQIEIGWRL